MTGADFDLIFQRKINQPYIDAYGISQRTELYREALMDTIESWYKNLDEQREYDYLNYIISTNYAVDMPANSQINLVDISPSYNHLLAVRAICKDFTWNNTVRSYDATNQIITFAKRSALRDQELLHPAHGSLYLYVKQINNYQYKLYNDFNLTEVFDSTLQNTELERWVSYWCKPIYSDNKIDPFQEATIYYPRYEVADQALKITPYAIKILIDYLRQPPVQIDPTDTTTDIEAFYPYKFLMAIADSATTRFMLEVKDTNYGVMKQEQFTDMGGRAMQ